MLLQHLSAEPIVLDRTRQYEQTLTFKPNGLWYQVDGDWEQWCKENDFDNDKLNCKQTLELEAYGILDVKDIDAFHNEYTVGFTGMINWKRVASAYSGIQIAPYSWKHRLKYMWYYGWDVASGCIWDINVITKFEEEPV